MKNTKTSAVDALKEYDEYLHSGKDIPRVVKVRKILLEKFYLKTRFSDIPSHLLEGYFESEVHKRTIENIKRDIENRKMFANENGKK